jgi:hypothetical protein
MTRVMIVNVVREVNCYATFLRGSLIHERWGLCLFGLLLLFGPLPLLWGFLLVAVVVGWR